MIQQALADQQSGLGSSGSCSSDDEALDLLASAADGDARRALNLLEIANDLASESGDVARY